MTNILFDLIKNGAQACGVVVSKKPPPGSFERHLRDYLSQMQINVVLDVGAFVGNYALQLRKIGYQGRIISFEPVPASYKKLSQVMGKDPLWVGYPFGLSDENRDALMNTHSSGDFNSLLTLREDVEHAYVLDPSCRGQANIQLKRLDAVLPQLIEKVESPRIFMKVDTQGHDLSVLKGASGVVDSILGFQSELPAVKLYEDMPSMATLLDYYGSCKFVPIGFYPVNTFCNLQVSPEFDVLFNRFEGTLQRSQVI